jgi:hypothetical protein
MWHAFADTRGLRPPSVRPNHLAAPWRRRARWDVPPPLGNRFGIPKPSRTRRFRDPNRPPGTTGEPKSSLFRYLPVLLGGKGTSHVGWDTGDLPSQGKNLLTWSALGVQEASRMDTKLHLRLCRHRDLAKDAHGAGKIRNDYGLDEGALEAAHATLLRPAAPAGAVDSGF